MGFYNESFISIKLMNCDYKMCRVLTYTLKKLQNI